MSIARNHKHKKLAEKHALLSHDAIDDNASHYELMLAQLITHQRQLSQIQSIERRVSVKAELLAQYSGYVDGIIAANAGAQDDVLMTVMMWRIDVGDVEGAIEIADYAIEHDLAMPERFKRDTATLIAEEMAEYAMMHCSEASDETPDNHGKMTEHLLHVLALT
ncbi:phage terminase small subunit, partial [Alteromonas sp. a30]|uniref:phage terminase small subunit n=1 Tax=Alteromonas sp. a30 TaxID=2730917 RepID=UPI0022804A3D